MSGWYILSTLTFLPLVGALFILAIRGDDDVARRNIRATALSVTVINFLLSLLAWSSFDPSQPGFQLEDKVVWLGGLMTYHMGVDGISMPFVMLTAAIMPLCAATLVVGVVPQTLVGVMSATVEALLAAFSG